MKTAPYSWKETGKPQGIDIHIAKTIADDIGVDAPFNFVWAGQNLEADPRNNLWKGALVGGCIANVMMRIPYAKAAYPEEKPIPAYFRFDTVAVENDRIADFYLSSLARGQLQANIRRFPMPQTPWRRARRARPRLRWVLWCRWNSHGPRH